MAQAAKLTSMRPYMKSNGDVNGVEPKSSDAGDDVELNLTGTGSRESEIMQPLRNRHTVRL